MGSPIIFKGTNAKMLASGGLEFKNGVTIEHYSGNPNDTIERAKGSIILDTSTGELYINTDGAKAWKKYFRLEDLKITPELDGKGTEDEPLGLTGLIQSGILRVRTGDSNASTFFEVTNTSGYTVSRLISDGNTISQISSDSATFYSTSFQGGKTNAAVLAREEFSKDIFSFGTIDDSGDDNKSNYNFSTARNALFKFKNVNGVFDYKVEDDSSVLYYGTFDPNKFTIKSNGSQGAVNYVTGLELLRNSHLKYTGVYDWDRSVFGVKAIYPYYDSTEKTIFSVGGGGSQILSPLKLLAAHTSGYHVEGGEIYSGAYYPKTVEFGPNYPIDTGDVVIKDGCVYAASGIYAHTPSYRYDSETSSYEHTFKSYSSKGVIYIENKNSNAPHVTCSSLNDAFPKVKIFQDKINVANSSTVNAELNATSCSLSDGTNTTSLTTSQLNLSGNNNFTINTSRDIYTRVASYDWYAYHLSSSSRIQSFAVNPDGSRIIVTPSGETVGHRYNNIVDGVVEIFSLNRSQNEIAANVLYANGGGVPIATNQAALMLVAEPDGTANSYHLIIDTFYGNPYNTGIKIRNTDIGIHTTYTLVGIDSTTDYDFSQSGKPTIRISDGWAKTKRYYSGTDSQPVFDRVASKNDSAVTSFIFG